MTNILVIDDHPLVTDGIKTMLAAHAEMLVAASAKTAKEALALLEQRTFDIILLDISLPDGDGLTLCAEIRKTNKQSKIIGLSSTNETGIITQFLQRGGNGYLLKNMERQELIEAIENSDIQLFTDVVKEFETITKLSMWETSLLLKIKTKFDQCTFLLS